MLKHKLQWRHAVCAVALITTAGVGPASADVAVCAAEQAIACTPFEPCDRNLPGAVNLPVLMKIDTSASVIHSLRSNDEERTSAIASMSETEGSRTFQGVDNNHPWSIQIDQTTGRMTATISSGDTAFIVFGECSWGMVE